jgi:uncharacterized iron-regulated membrane protein
MKLKGLGTRAYNALFHTHTVAGIVISFALFVVFYAGAFALFRHEIVQWENPDMRQALKQDVSLDEAIAKVNEVFDLDFHEITNVYFPTKHSPVVYVYGARHDTDTTTERMAAYVNLDDMSVQNVREPLTTVGDTIYHLHFFDQIPARIGLYLAGFVSLFFLFSVITGLLIHWRNLLTKFYGFVKEAKWKVIWTNAHTVLGVIGLPFQVIYAVTGAFFGLLTLILLPSVLLIYDGDSSKVFEKVQPQLGIEVEENAPVAQHITLTELSKLIAKKYPEFQIVRAQLRNYGREDAVATLQIDDHRGMLSSGTISMSMKDGQILDKYSIYPNQKSYSNAVTDYIFKLHFATFEGPFIKVLYFILSMITCFMIISGVLIWRTARDNAQYSLKQRMFHHRVTKWYLSICLSMFPAFAIIFLANKLVPMDMPGRVGLVNQIFFLSWLGLTIVGYFWNKYSQQNRNFLIIGGFLSLLVPVVNGLSTGGWIWNMWGQYPSVVYVDVFWLLAGMTALYVSFFVLKVKRTSDIPEAIMPTKSSKKPGNGKYASVKRTPKPHII